MGAYHMMMKISTDVECVNCGVIVYMSEVREQILRDTHKQFYCLNGHSQWFPKIEVNKEEVKKPKK